VLEAKRHDSLILLKVFIATTAQFMPFYIFWCSAVFSARRWQFDRQQVSVWPCMETRSQRSFVFDCRSVSTY